MGKITYLVSWEECDESSFAGGSWDTVTRAFTNKEEARLCAHKIFNEQQVEVKVVKAEIILKLG